MDGIKLVDLRPYGGLAEMQFAFFDPHQGEFQEFNGRSAWRDWAEFEADAEAEGIGDWVEAFRQERPSWLEAK